MRAIIATLMAFFTTHFSSASKPLLVIDSINNKLPARYREIDEAGLRLIGSGQFTKSQLLSIQKKINSPLFIIDLRQESHGFVNDLPISLYGKKNWQNRGLTNATIEHLQQQWLQSIQQHSKLTAHKILAKNQHGQIIKTEPLELIPTKTCSEKRLTQQMGIGYARFYIADHSLPTPKQLAKFKQLVTTIPENTWVYIHCRGGIGRTTLFMVLYEIIKTGKNKSLEAILSHQIAIGGRDFNKLPHPSSYKYQEALARLNLITNFYQHIHNPKFGN